MVAFILDFFRRHPCWLLMLLCALALGLLTLDVRHVTAQRAAAFAQLARANAEQDRLRAQLDTQNLAVDAWKGAADIQARRAQAAEHAAARVRTVTQTRVQRILVDRVPADCAAAVEWGRAQGVVMARLWEANQ